MILYILAGAIVALTMLTGILKTQTKRIMEPDELENEWPKPWSNEDCFEGLAEGPNWMGKLYAIFLCKSPKDLDKAANKQRFKSHAMQGFKLVLDMKETENGYVTFDEVEKNVARRCNIILNQLKSNKNKEN